MNKKKQIVAGMVLIAAMLACNLPSTQQVEGAATALAQSQTAEAAGGQSSPGQAAATPSNTAESAPAPVEATPTNTFTATPCTGSVTANLNANVRGGPSTDYDIVGFLPTGGTAPIAGQNDAQTWWYITFAGGPGGHAWIAKSVTTAACVPAGLAIVAAPPLPPTLTPSPTEVVEAPPEFAVTHISYSLSYFNDGSYVHCPQVTAQITANGEGDVDYHWTRSDGASAPTESIHFNSAGTKSVTEQWRLGSVWNGQSHWLGIYVDSPNHQDFGHKSFNTACTSP